MVYHYECSTYNSHHKVLINLQASNMDDHLCCCDCCEFGAYNFLITYSGIGMLNTYATKSHPSYISSNSLNGMAYHQTTCSIGLYFYITVIRPISDSEYACTVWNHNLISTLSDQLESYQERALRVIPIYSSWLIWNL